MHWRDLRGLKSAQMVFPWEEMNVPAGLNLHMDTAVPWIITSDKMAGSRMVFKMGFLVSG